MDKQFRLKVITGDQHCVPPLGSIGIGWRDRGPKGEYLAFIPDSQDHWPFDENFDHLALGEEEVAIVQVGGSDGH